MRQEVLYSSQGCVMSHYRTHVLAPPVVVAEVLTVVMCGTEAAWQGGDLEQAGFSQEASKACYVKH